MPCLRVALSTRYRAYNNKPPLKDFWTPDFSTGFYYSKKSWHFFQVLIIPKKFRLRRALIIIFFSKGQIWALWRSIFKQNPRFCLKIPLKKFRLRRAGRCRFLLFSKKFPPAAGSYYYHFFKIRIFSRFLLFSQNLPNFLFCSYYYHFEGGVLIIIIPVHD